ncbi:hypothetical protein COV93_04275 [Candidatus Woesearchaeota archaeon CG11_big_fil_rev_8_21_14_0_20_43_8]|nr:MAG: hypothetical protein COV93_04275 [Candidatus Woesearchaeota archaeon CG11_big_fil_rev_8_21_14_0_20_43_8]
MRFKKETTNDLKPKFMIAEKTFDIKSVPGNIIAEHLELEMKKRDELGDLRLPKARLKALLRK